MTEPFLAEIRIMSFNFSPKGWALCTGQLIAISQNTALFSLLGTTFGGNGINTFGLPDLRGRVPIHVGNGHTLGESGGEQAHTLSISELPTHIHTMQASASAADSSSPGGYLLATPPAALYRSANNLAAMHASSAGNIGGSQSHLNMQPFFTLSFCIALGGVFPT